MLSPNYPVLCFSLPYRVAPVFVQVVSPSLGRSPLPSFLVIWSPTGDTRGPSVVFEAVDMPCPGPFHFSYSVDYIYDFCPLPDPDVGLSVFVCDVEHTSFHFCLCGRKFVLCLFGQCPCLCTICHSWQHTGVVGETGASCYRGRLLQGRFMQNYHIDGGVADSSCIRIHQGNH